MVKVDLGNRSEFRTANGAVHCDDGPAVQWADGRKEWFHHGLRHRLDGRAVEYSSGGGEWYIGNHRLDDEELCDHLRKMIRIELLATREVYCRIRDCTPDVPGFAGWSSQYHTLWYKCMKAGVDLQIGREETKVLYGHSQGNS